jgi:hypothetical protein
MRLAGRALATTAVVLVTIVASCGQRPEDHDHGIGHVGSGGGGPHESGRSEGGGEGGSSGEPGEDGGDHHHDGGPGGGGGSSSGGSGSSGSSGGASGSGTASGASAGTSSGSGGITDAGDAGDASGGIHLMLGGSVHLVSLHWTIHGPNSYSGSVTFGDAQSVEWVIGGIAAGIGYTLSVTAVDETGDACNGTSTPFSVQQGIVNYTMLTITCYPMGGGGPADVTTGSVAIDASVVAAD